jgi:hypothetical protein
VSIESMEEGSLYIKDALKRTTVHVSIRRLCYLN